MHRPGSAAQRFGQLLDCHPGQVFSRIHLCWRRGKNHLSAGLSANLQVGLKRTRIFLKIFARPELRGIDKNADDDEIAIFNRCFYQRDMANVKRAHGRHKTNSFTHASNGAYQAFNLFNCFCHFHLKISFGFIISEDRKEGRDNLIC